MPAGGTVAPSLPVAGSSPVPVVGGVAEVAESIAGAGVAAASEAVVGVADDAAAARSTSGS